MLLSGKKQMTGALHKSTVHYFKASAVNKYYNSTKYSCTTVHTWVLPKHAITSINSALTISSTVYHNEGISCTVGLWMLLTTGQEMSL